MSNLIPPPNSRWADYITVSGCASPEEEANIRTRLAGPMPDCYGVACCELRKTTFEIKAIAHISALMDRMAQSMNLRPRGIAPKRIHMLNQSDYRLLLGSGDDARTVLGHTYIARTEDRTSMMYLLTHELAHLSSFLSVVGYVDDESVHTSWKRSGYTTQTRCRGNTFTGLNEAAAEITAGLIRDMLLRYSNLLNEQQRQILSSGYIYAPQVRVVQALTEIVSKHEACDNADPLMSVIYGFLSGDLSFLRRVGRAVSGSVPILRAMSEEPTSALIAAYALGLDEVYSSIEAHLESLDIINLGK